MWEGAEDHELEVCKAWGGISRAGKQMRNTVVRTRAYASVGLLYGEAKTVGASLKKQNAHLSEPLGHKANLHGVSVSEHHHPLLLAAACQHCTACWERLLDMSYIGKTNGPKQVNGGHVPFGSGRTVVHSWSSPAVHAPL